MHRLKPVTVDEAAAELPPQQLRGLLQDRSPLMKGRGFERRQPENEQPLVGLSGKCLILFCPPGNRFIRVTSDGADCYVLPLANAYQRTFQSTWDGFVPPATYSVRRKFI